MRNIPIYNTAPSSRPGQDVKRTANQEVTGNILETPFNNNNDSNDHLPTQSPSQTTSTTPPATAEAREQHLRVPIDGPAVQPNNVDNSNITVRSEVGEQDVL